jgi:hypothetical protein
MAEQQLEPNDYYVSALWTPEKLKQLVRDNADVLMAETLSLCQVDTGVDDCTIKQCYDKLRCICHTKSHRAVDRDTRLQRLALGGLYPFPDGMVERARLDRLTRTHTVLRQEMEQLEFVLEFQAGIHHA